MPHKERYDDWHLKFDDAFATAYLASVAARVVPRGINSCCSCCRGIFTKSHGVDAAERCGICHLIVRVSVDALDVEGNISLFLLGRGPEVRDWMTACFAV
jgi:hypothetical protein